MSKKAWVAYGSRKDVGASPLFSPLHHGIETAAPDLQGRLYRSPLLYGPKQSRWTLQALQEQVDWLQHTRTGNPVSLPGICKLLDRLGVTYKRGRAHLHSPTCSTIKRWPTSALSMYSTQLIQSAMCSYMRTN
jgi:hypothetical protein